MDGIRATRLRAARDARRTGWWPPADPEVVGVSEGEAAAADAPAQSATAGTDDSGFDTKRATTVLLWAGVVVLAVTAAVALTGFYTGVTGTIRVFVSEPYRPLFRAAFNLALLLAALGGIGLLVRRAN